MRKVRNVDFAALSNKTLAKWLTEGAFYMGSPPHRDAMKEAAKRLERILTPGPK